MKLLCCGDFHLGAGADYGPRPGDRLRDQEAVLDRIAAVAREEDVAAVLFAGDAFERRSPTPPELMVWRDFVGNRLAHDYIPRLCISGNHDVAAADLPTAMEVVGSCGRIPEVSHLGDGVGLATLPWTPPARLVAAEGGGDRDTIHERAAELLLESARGLREMVDGPCILLAHWSVTGASTPTGIPTEQFREPVLDANALEAMGWDAIVLGHIHKAQSPLGTADRGGPFFYVGSPMPLNFGETGCDHGVWLLDTDEWSAEFVPIESRPFVTVSADFTEPGEYGPFLGDGGMLKATTLDVTDCLTAVIAEHFPLTDAVVRIRCRATAEQARRIDLGAIRQLVADAGASKLFAVQPDIVRSDRARVEGLDEGIGETQALDLWLASQEVALDHEKFSALSQKHFDYLEAVRA